MSVLRISLVNSLTRTRVRLCDAIHSDIFVAIADDFVSFVSIFAADNSFSRFRYF